MGKILVIAEKPSVAVDYAKALNQYNNKNGYFEGDKYVITWAMGHVVSRKELYEYDPNINRAYQNREHVLNTVPFFPEKHILKLALMDSNRFSGDKNRLAYAKRHNDGIQGLAKNLEMLLSRDDIDFVVNGCDSGREGEAIFWQIYEYFQSSLPVMRLWLSSSTAQDIRDAFGDLRPAKDYHNLKLASYARAEMDWEHGLNLSALYASLYSAPLSMGRVQTPVLNMVVERENEIKNFKPKDYFLMDANFSTKDGFNYKGKLVINDFLGDFVEDGKIVSLPEINNISEAVSSKEGFIKSIDKSKKKEQPKLLYNLTDLQIEMSSKHKISVQDVLDLAQSLYEKHKLITYPRTSSQYLNESMKEDAFNRLNYLPKEYDNAVDYAQKSGCFFDKVLNDSKVEDHYGLMPTTNSKDYDLSNLSKNELILYTAIVKRFIGLFMPPHEYESTTIVTAVDKYDFKTTGKKILKQGWRSLYNSQEDSLEDDEKDDSKDAQQDLTYNFEKDMSVLCDKANVASKKTLPPKRYTEASLLKAMDVGGPKNLSITDQDAIDMLKERGLGTTATRAGIVETLKKREYVVTDKKTTILPTAKGLDFIGKIKIEMLKSTEITGEWERKLNLVQKGKLSKDELIETARDFIRECVKNAKESYVEGDSITQGTEISCKCPVCGGKIFKTPSIYYCENSSKKDNGCSFKIFAKILGKTLKDTDIKDICNKGETKAIKGFVSANKKDSDGKPLKFDGILYFDKDSGRLQFKRGEKKARKETDFVCPNCKKNLIEFEQGYGCSGYSDGCKFSIFKNIYSYSLTPTDIEALLSSGETKVLSDLYNPKNPQKKFSAKVVFRNGVVDVVRLNENGEEDVAKSTSLFCPCCKKAMNEYSNYFRCSGCSFAVSKKIAGVELSDAHIKNICVDGDMQDYIDFQSSAGKPFKAKLIVDVKSKKLQFKGYSVASEYKCPLCSSEMGENDSRYVCSKCTFVVWKSIGPTKLSDSIIGEILNKGQTADYIDLVSSKGKEYKAKLVVNKKTKKVEFMFPSSK